MKLLFTLASILFSSYQILIPWNDIEEESYILFKEYGSSEYFLEPMEILGPFIYHDMIVLAEDYYIIPYGGQATSKNELESNGRVLKEQKKVTIEIVGESTVHQDTTNNAFDRINKALKKLYTGYQIDFVVNDSYDFSSCNRISGFDDIIDHKLLSSEYRYHAILSNDIDYPNSEVTGADKIDGFNSASNSSHQVILGKRDILQNNFLFIHEFIHCILTSETHPDSFIYSIEGTEYIDVMHTDLLPYCRYALGRNNYFKMHRIDISSMDIAPYAFGVRDTRKTCDIPYKVLMETMEDRATSVKGGHDFMPSDWYLIEQMLENQHELYFEGVADKDIYVRDLKRIALKDYNVRLVNKYSKMGVKFDKNLNSLEKAEHLENLVKTKKFSYHDINKFTDIKPKDGFIYINNTKLPVYKEKYFILPQKMMNVKIKSIKVNNKKLDVKSAKIQNNFIKEIGSNTGIGRRI